MILYFAGPEAEMAGVTGLEPATSGVTGQRSKPAELHPRRVRALYVSARMVSRKLALGRRQLTVGVRRRFLVVEEDAVCGPFEVLELAVPQRPQEGAEAEQSKQQRRVVQVVGPGPDVQER